MIDVPGFVNGHHAFFQGLGQRDEVFALYAGLAVDKKNLQVPAEVGPRQTVVRVHSDSVGTGGLSAGRAAAQHQTNNG